MCEGSFGAPGRLHCLLLVGTHTPSIPFPNPLSHPAPLLLASAQRPGAQVPAGQLSPSEINLSILQPAKSARFRRVTCSAVLGALVGVFELESGESAFV